MADVLSKAQRSLNMSQIKATDTKPEMLVRKFLFSKGFRYRLHDRKLPGRPDIVLPKYKSVILVHGCFWHAHKGCYVEPKTNTDWWREKINGNKKRDKVVIRSLKRLGWKVICVFECELKSSCREKTFERILNFL